MRFLLKLSYQIDRLTEMIGQFADWIVILMIAVGFFNVAARYIGRFIGIQLSSNALLELQWYLFSLIFFFGFAYILKHGENVRVDILYANWPEKRKIWIDFLGTIFFLIPFCLMGIWVTFNPVLQSWGSWEISPDADGLPRAPIKTMIIVTFILLLMQSISQTIKYLAILLGFTEVAEVVKEQTSENLPFE